jgi:hypothetical protein
MFEPFYLKITGSLFAIIAFASYIAHVRPYTLFSASQKKIHLWSISETAMGMCGLMLLLSADHFESQAPFPLVFFFWVAAIIFSPLLVQLQIETYKKTLEHYKKLNELIQSRGVEQKAKWWLFFNRNLPSVFFDQDRSFWKNGFTH